MVMIGCYLQDVLCGDDRLLPVGCMCGDDKLLPAGCIVR